jgi:hypothetical protein
MTRQQENAVNFLAIEQNFIKFAASLVVQAVCERGIEGFR